MTEQQYRVIADRDKGDDPRAQDVQDGDRYVLDAPFLGDARIVRIERPIGPKTPQKEIVVNTNGYVPPQTEDEQSEEDREALDQYEGPA